MQYATWILGFLLLSAPPAAADSDAASKAEALTVEGIKLGRAGEYRKAIAKFKQADRIQLRGLTSCNIGLAYSRLKRFHQAYWFLLRCKKLWPVYETSPIDSWVLDLIGITEKRLRWGRYAQVTIDITPPDATISGVGFAADEVITGENPIWLPVGHFDVVARYPGYSPTTRTIQIAQGKSLHLSIAMAPTPDPSLAAGTRPHLPSPRSKAIWVFGGIGGASLVGGGIFHVLASQAKKDAEQLGLGPQFDQKRKTFRTRRAITIGLYGVGTAAVATSLYLWLRKKSKNKKDSRTLLPSWTIAGTANSRFLQANWSM